MVELATVLLLEFGRSLAEHAAIAIAKRDEILGEAFDVIAAAAVQSDRRHANLTIDVGPRELGQAAKRETAAAVP